MTIKGVRIIQITTEYIGIYLVINTKKPWWKKKEWYYIGPMSCTTFDLMGERVDYDTIYYKYENDMNKVFPLKEYAGACGL